MENIKFIIYLMCLSIYRGCFSLSILINIKKNSVDFSIIGVIFSLRAQNNIFFCSVVFFVSLFRAKYLFYLFLGFESKPHDIICGVIWGFTHFKLYQRTKVKVTFNFLSPKFNGWSFFDFKTLPRKNYNTIFCLCKMRWRHSAKEKTIWKLKFFFFDYIRK